MSRRLYQELFLSMILNLFFASASESNTKAHAAYFHAMLDAGIYLAPSQFEAMLVSSAHTDADIDLTIQAAKLGFTAAAKLM